MVFDLQLECVSLDILIRKGKRGSVPDNLPSILDRIGIEPKNWIELTRAFEENTKTFVGHEDRIESAAFSLGYKRTPHRQNCKNLFG